MRIYSPKTEKKEIVRQANSETKGDKGGHSTNRLRRGITERNTHTHTHTILMILRTRIGAEVAHM